MTRREEIVTATFGCRQGYVDLKRPITPDDVADAFEKGAYWADKTMIDEFVAKLHKLKCDYENDLDAEPRVYERDIQLCAKISLIERLILELKEEEK
jgi:hypothetical protein